MRVLVCGGRVYDDRRTAFAVLDRVLEKYPALQVIEGGARGADRLAQEWARQRNVPWQTVPADWARYGKSAGYKRNTLMCSMLDSKTDFVIAFPGGRGTTHMINIATTARVRVWQPHLTVEVP